MIFLLTEDSFPKSCGVNCIKQKDPCNLTVGTLFVSWAEIYFVICRWQSVFNRLVIKI